MQVNLGVMKKWQLKELGDQSLRRSELNLLKKNARRAAPSAKRLEKLENSRGGYGLLFAELEEPKKKRTKKAKAVPAVENMTPGKRAQYEAEKVANRLYGAKAISTQVYLKITIADIECVNGWEEEESCYTQSLQTQS